MSLVGDIVGGKKDGKLLNVSVTSPVKNRLKKVTVKAKVSFKSPKKQKATKRRKPTGFNLSTLK
ncbi:MAG: hypothetical protein KGI66_01030 [Patescibacteria group bacterium]|nr:hypothetical protein [Patescibacteria group bacterium]